MTIKATQRAIRELGLTCGRTAYGEFRVNLRPCDGGTEGTAYYTHDGDDAIGTAKAMLKYRRPAVGFGPNVEYLFNRKD